MVHEIKRVQGSGLPVMVFSDANGQPGVLRIDGTSLVLETEQAERTFDIVSVACRAGGMNDSTLFLTHPDMPGVEMAIERSVASSLKDLPQMEDAMAAAPRLVLRQRLFWSGVVAALLLGVVLVLMLLVFLGRIVL